jgi:hypothetical protein
VPELDVATPLRPASEGEAARPAAERVGLHRDVDGACATLQAAWPQPHLDDARPDIAAAAVTAHTRRRITTLGHDMWRRYARRPIAAPGVV